VQVNHRIGLGFAEVLRSFLRADPDVIMVGEMRDRTTAAVGIEASLTGHLVLSTLQANSAPETLTRLIGMDIDTMSFADALRGVLSQRLVRRLCEHCRAPHTPTPEEWQQIGRSTTTKDEFVAAAETEINKRGRKLNRYLLFMDAKLAAAGIDEQTLDAWWNIAHHALQQTLPGLRLVRLKGREAEWKKECGLISDIRGLHTP
jgi:type II secretory ATPase GspE/PulE/Tfp pilus assembly ATPase PilB-like protein